MTVSETVRRANVIVSKAETNYIRDLRIQYEKMKDTHPDQAENILAEIITESDRWKPTLLDEEEDLLRKLG